MKKLLLLSLLSVILLSSSCKKDAETETRMKATMTYELDVVEQDNISHYIIQTSMDASDWTDMGMILAAEDGMEHKYSIDIDVSRFYKKGERFYQRTLSYDKGVSAPKISKVTSIIFD